MSTKKGAEGDAIQVDVTDNGLDHLKEVDLHDKTLAHQAHEGNAQEHNVDFLQALKLHKRAAFWSMRTFRDS